MSGNPSHGSKMSFLLILPSLLRILWAVTAIGWQESIPDFLKRQISNRRLRDLVTGSTAMWWRSCRSLTRAKAT